MPVYFNSKEDIFELLERFSNSRADEISIKTSEVEINLKKYARGVFLPEAVNTVYSGGETALPEEPSLSAPHGGKTVKAPLIGTFYASPSPGSSPFVKIGDKVKKGDVLCIIEAMKVMNEIESDYEGTITNILVNDKSAVEYGQELFVITEI